MTLRQYLKVPDEVSWHMPGMMGPGIPERFNSLDSLQVTFMIVFFF